MINHQTQELKIKAENIHDVIYKIASDKSVMIGRSSASAIPLAIDEIRKHGFRKPFFANPELWIKKLIVKNKDAYVHLSPHIKLEFIVDGKPHNWRGNGIYINFKKMTELFMKEDPEIRKKFPPLWLQINLGFDYEVFSKILYEIPSQK